MVYCRYVPSTSFLFYIFDCRYCTAYAEILVIAKGKEWAEAVRAFTLIGLNNIVSKYECSHPLIHNAQYMSIVYCYMAVTTGKNVYWDKLY